MKRRAAATRWRPPHIRTKLSPLKAGSLVAELGASGMGKSTATKDLLAREQEHWPILWFDPDDEYSIHGRESDQVVLGPLLVRVTWDEYLDLPADVLDDPNLSMAVVPDPDPDEAAEQFAHLVRDVESTGSLLFGFDEPGKLFRRKVAAAACDHLLTRARKWGERGCAVAIATQRLAMLPIDGRGMLNEIEAFWLSEPADVDALSDRCGRDFARRVTALPKGQSLLWAPNRNTNT